MEDVPLEELTEAERVNMGEMVGETLEYDERFPDRVVLSLLDPPEEEPLVPVRPSPPNRQRDVGEAALSRSVDLAEECCEVPALECSDDGNSSVSETVSEDDDWQDLPFLEDSEDDEGPDANEASGCVPPPSDFSDKPLLTRRGFVSFAGSKDQPRAQGLSDVLVAGLHEVTGSKCRASALKFDEKVVSIFASHHYTVDTIVAPQKSNLGTVMQAVLDTGAGPSFIKECKVPAGATIHPLPREYPGW